MRKRFSDKGFLYLKKIIQSWNRGDGPREGFYTEDIQKGVYFLRVNNLKNHSIDLTDVKYITRQVHEKTLKRAQVTKGDVVFAISGTKDNLGTVSIIPDNIQEANLNSAIVRLNLDTSKIDKSFFCYLFDLKFIRTQIDYIGKGVAQNNLNNEEIEQIQIPNYSIIEQQDIVNKFDLAISQKQSSENAATELLNSFEDCLSDFGIKIPVIEYVDKLFVNLQQLEDALNVERYAIFYDKSSLKWTTIDNLGDVKLLTIVPASDFYKDKDFTLMRIDDLPNKPQKAVTRQVKGKQIAGNVQKVSENDVLVARLEPTIVNKKIVSVPKSENKILASNEFIRLHCNEENNPLFVKYMLQTDFYTQLMTSKTRGATPSRRRLSRLDFEKLPFPKIDKTIQDKIAIEFEKRILKAEGLLKSASEDYLKVKQEIEDMIIN